MNELRTKEFAFASLAAPEWIGRGAGRVWVRGYEALRARKEDVLAQDSPHLIDLGASRAFLMWGQITYWTADQTSRVDRNGVVSFEVRAVRACVSDEAAHAILMVPNETDGQQGDAGAAQALADCEGFLIALLGKNVIFRRLFDNVYGLRDGSVTITGPAVENPFYFKPPFERDAISIAISAAGALRQIPSTSSQAARVRLSLRWFGSAAHRDGIDAFLSYWIAIETLAMEGSTDIAPLNRKLAHIYDLPAKDAASRFGIGKLYGLRSRIVHLGERVGFDARVLHFLEAVYSDLLFHELGLTSLERARAFLANSDFDVQGHLRETLRAIR